VPASVLTAARKLKYSWNLTRFPVPILSKVPQTMLDERFGLFA